jgi:hypothetical protein
MHNFAGAGPRGLPRRALASARVSVGSPPFLHSWPSLYRGRSGSAVTLLLVTIWVLGKSAHTDRPVCAFSPYLGVSAEHCGDHRQPLGQPAV